MAGFVSENKVATPSGSSQSVGRKRWLLAWTASPQPPFANGVSRAGLQGQTLRMAVCPHRDGAQLRLCLSHAFDEGPMRIASVHVARSLGGEAAGPASDRSVTFDGCEQLVVEADAAIQSDLVTLDVVQGGDLAVFLYVREASGRPHGRPARSKPRP